MLQFGGGSPAAVSNVSSPDAGITFYTPGQTVHIYITFNAPVYITGAPYLVLSLGGARIGYAYYDGTPIASSGSASTFEFDYTVRVGDNTTDLDYANLSALTLGGGTIKDLVGNDVTLALPALGSLDSLASSFIQIIA